MGSPNVMMMIVVHNAFRRDLTRMQAAAAEADDRATRAALRKTWTTFSRYLSVHHLAEDEMLWPPLQAKLSEGVAEETLLVEMAHEHAQLDPLMKEIDEALAHGSASRLIRLFEDLGTVLTGHLDHEESAALPLVQQKLSVAEWKSFTNDQRRRVGLRSAGTFFPWLLDGTPPQVRDRVLGIIPPPLRVVYRTVWEPRYRRRSPWVSEQSSGRPAAR
ncbi:hemerythrin domain-containing protein [Nocardia aobensis]|uniref:hemerythrin domain-containing protein n=1 Tax=Nocardia aobensis TaxID=257277 RepID=UPI0007C69610|nr:hemerythrin domain-containing protein [Nocardia aobensis]